MTGTEIRFCQKKLPFWVRIGQGITLLTLDNFHQVLQKNRNFTSSALYSLTLGGAACSKLVFFTVFIKQNFFTDDASFSVGESILILKI